ncbi:MAG: phosphatidate cytidylyltransferase [Gemmatimonadales bacterium]
MASNLARRVAFAVVAIPTVLWVLYLGGWPLVGLLSLVGALGTWEVYGLAQRQSVYPFAGLGLLGAVAIPVVAYSGLVAASQREAVACFVCPAPVAWIPLAALWLMAIFGVAIRTRAPSERPLAAIAITVVAPLYASALLAFVLVLRGAAPRSWMGLGAAALPLVLVWVCDTVAMAAGRLLGGPKLAPVLSPNKTWAGAIGGTLAAVAAAVAYGPLVLARLDAAPLPPPGQLAVLGAVVSVFGQLGDVAESLLKRESGVKDSSSRIPGHGGVLDRLDSLYFAVPAAAILGSLFL